MLIGWLGRLLAKPLSAASQSASRKWAWRPGSQSDKSVMKSGMKSVMNTDANRRTLLLLLLTTLLKKEKS